MSPLLLLVLRTASLTFAVLVLWLVSGRAPADEGMKLWLSPGGVSYHTNRAHGFNERNEGVLLRVAFNQRHSLIAGVYRNSNDERSRMLAYRYTPFITDTAYGAFKAGVVAGAVDGYQVHDGRAIPVLLPVLAWESRWVGLSALVIPPVQKHIPSWVFGLQAEVALW